MKFTITQNDWHENHFHNILCLSEVKGMDINMNIPTYLQSFYRLEKEEKTKYYYNISGMICCCGSNEFEVNYCGNVYYNLLKNKYFVKGENKVILNAKCRKCKRIIHIFDSEIDGYDNCVDLKDEKIKSNDKELIPFICDNCHHNMYKIKVRYEYPALEELENFSIQNRNNSFTWIRISFVCKNCGKKFKNIVDFEMG